MTFDGGGSVKEIGVERRKQAQTVRARGGGGQGRAGCGATVA